EHAFESAPELVPGNGLSNLFLDCVQPILNLREVDRGSKHPGAQQALAHGGHRRVQAMKEGDAGVGRGKQRLDQLQIAHGYRVEHQAVLTFVKSDAVDVVEGATLGTADVIENGTRSGSGSRFPGEAKAFEREYPKVIF